MKIQGSLEYLIIFASILAVALMLIFLLGNQSKGSNEALIKQSQAYWENKKPIGVIGFSQKGFEASGATFVMMLKNNGLRKITVTRVASTSSYNGGVFLR